MAELPLRPAPLAQGTDALSDLEAALETCERLLDGELRIEDGAEPSFPLSVALADQEHGPWVRRFLAGDPRRPSRREAARWRVLHADLPQALRELTRRMWPLLDEGDGPRLQLRVSQVLSRLEQARSEPAPRLTSLAEERSRAVEMGRRYLVDDPEFEEATEIHRWGLFGRSDVRGGTFARLVICERLQGWRLPLEPALARVLEDADADGWRHYPTLLQVPRDAELAGMVLQLARPAGWTAHPLVRQLEQDMVVHLDDHGLPATWLGNDRPQPSSPGAFDWPQDPCPVAAASVLLGLWHLDAATHADRVRQGLGSLAAWVISHPVLTAPFSTEAICDARVLQALLGVEPGRWRSAEAVLIDRMRHRQSSSGLLGTPVETALAAVELARADALDWPDVVVRALVDSQQADGGWPADRLRSMVLHPSAPTPGSRTVTTAACLRALLEIGVPSP